MKSEFSASPLPSKTITFPEFFAGLLRFLIFRVPVILAIANRILEPDKRGRSNIGKYLEQNSLRYADRPALLFEDQRWTWRMFNEVVNRYANFLIGFGLKRGEVMAVLMENRPEMLFLIAAAAKIGAVASLINAGLRQEALRHCLQVASLKGYLIGAELVEAFEAVRSGLPDAQKERVFWVSNGSETQVPDHYLDFQALTRNAAVSNPDTVAEVTSHDAFAFVFTSGTTGLPKAAFQYHKSWCRAGNFVGKGLLRITPRDVVFNPLPLFHTNPLKLAWSSAHLNGAALAFCRKYSTIRFWNDIRRHGATVFNYVGELCTYLYNAPEKPDDADNPVRAILGNGLRPNIFKGFKKRFGIGQVLELYGASEGDLTSMNFLNLEETIGIFLYHAVVKYDPESERFARDSKGHLQKIARGEVGLLLGKATPKVLSGYLNRADTEKKIIRNAFKEGDAWFNTGDLVRSIGWGHYQFADRLGDTFRWKGENVATLEVEKAVLAFPNVEQCCVYGVQLPGFDGRVGMVSVVARGEWQAFDSAGLAEWLQKNLPAYAIPRFLRFVDRFETTPTHKIKKTELQRQGIDLNEINDPLFFLPAGASGYERLTPERHQQVVSGAIRF